VRISKLLKIKLNNINKRVRERERKGGEGERRIS
jgi:hypothetical protein